jgi:hypothetical protein
VHLGIKAKQIAGVSLIVGLAVVTLSLVHVTLLARVLLRESSARGDLLANAIFQRAREIVPGQADPYTALRTDAGLRAILESSAYSKNVTYAAICNVDGVAVAAWDPSREGKRLQPAGELGALIDRRGLPQLLTIYSSEGQTLEVRQPLLLGGAKFGSIRIGVSTLLVRRELTEALKPMVATALVALLIAVGVSASLAQLMLRPIHVIRSGLTRLGRGEFGVRLDLPQQDEFGELGSFFNTVSQQLSVDRSQLADQKASLQSAVEHMEDEVAIFNPAGELLFANPAIRVALPSDPFGQPIDDLLPAGHPYRELVRATIDEGQSRGPLSAAIPGTGDQPGAATSPNERLVTAHAIKDRDQHLVGVMLVVRDVLALGRVQSMLNYSRKLVALGRLSAGVAHEVKNPLNAMTIHLELLKQKLVTAIGRARRVPVAATAGFDSEDAPASASMVAVDDTPGELGRALDHVKIIGGEIQRLDQVMQGFLKFTRSEDLKLQTIQLSTLVDDVVRVVGPQCASAGVTVTTDGFDHAPDISGDPTMLRQAFLNLALNACQAMPHGGTLRIAAVTAGPGRLQIDFEDTGIGIKPEHLSRIFDLYFTTREKGSGIGLSMVYRTVQLHDGEVEVRSTEGHGTTFSLVFPTA